MAKSMDEYLESLNKAMSIHASEAVKNLSFNKTELAEVVDIGQRNEG